MALNVHYVIVLKAPEATWNWLAEELRQRGLEVEITQITRNRRTLLTIRLPDSIAPAAAQEVRLCKLHKSGIYCVFTVDKWKQFALKPTIQNAEELFTNSEKQEIVDDLIYGIRCGDQPIEIPGQRRHTIEPGQSIIGYCENYGILQACFPVHDYNALFELRKLWLEELSLPIYKIRSYLGVDIAFYFAFLSFYTWSLVTPMTIGVMTFVRGEYAFRWLILGTLFNVFYTAIVLEVWKSREFDLCCFWGIHEGLRQRTCLLYDRPKLGETRSLTWTSCKFIFSQVVVISCIVLTTFLTFANLQLDDFVKYTFPGNFNLDRILRLLPPLAAGIIFYIISDIYRVICVRLTENENHRTEDSFTQHLTAKLLIFDFFSRFGSLFYTAFYLQDTRLLRKQVYIQLIMSYTRDNVLEIALPKIVRHLTAMATTMVMRQNSLHFMGLHSVLGEADMAKYRGTYLDFYKLFCQTAYVFLFNSVVPLAPLIAFVGNIVEMYVDCFKLIMVFQRPRKSVSAGIGIWRGAMRVICFMAIPSNIALLTLNNHARLKTEWGFMSDFEMIIYLVLVEHGLLLALFLLQIAIRGQPQCIHQAHID